MAELSVEIVYALPGMTLARELCLPAGATVGQALCAAADLPEFAALDLPARPVAVFGRRAEPGQVLKPGDRIEVLRPLPQDPKEARRRRVSRSGGS